MKRGASFASLSEVVQARADRNSDRTAYVFLEDSHEARTITYAGLAHACARLATRLTSDSEPGDRVLLMLPPGIDYAIALFACLHAGRIAVPAFAPEGGPLDRALPRLRAIAADARASVALTTSQCLAQADWMRPHAAELQSLTWLAVDSDSGGAPCSPSPREIAVIQYTSGSTSDPRGVVLSHDNFLSNLAQIEQSFAQTAEGVGVCWLPPFHDMGLMSGILLPLYTGYPSVLMAPERFLNRPASWLEAVDRYHATITGGPNFAYDLCVRKCGPDQRARLDLRSWSVAFNGAEPIRADTLDRFSAAFAPSGFRRSAFVPCYGLAEATLLVTAAGVEEEPKIHAVGGDALAAGRIGAGETPVVSCGAPAVGISVAVVDREGARQPAGIVGEVWIAGPNVARGYWGRPSDPDFDARLADTPGARFLRTGDLGAWVDGQLLITGRTKDLIIVRGRNYYPQDLERAAEAAHPAIRAGGVAAFTREIADRGEPAIVLVCEADAERVSTSHDLIARAVRRAIARHIGLPVQELVFVAPRAIPKTSSGKIRRRACRAALLADELRGARSSRATVQTLEGPDSAWIRAASGTARVALLCELIRAIASRHGMPDAELAQSLFDLAPDSMSAVDLATELHREFGIEVSLADLMRDDPIAEFAARLAPALDEGAAREPPADQTTLTSRQASLWLMQQIQPVSTAYNVAFALRLNGKLDRHLLRDAIALVHQRQPQLQLAIELRDGEPRAVCAPCPQLIEAQRGDDLQDTLTRLAALPFDLQAGPLWRVAWVEDDSPILLVCAHHLVADYASLHILRADLDAALTHGRLPALQRSQTRAIEAPPAGFRALSDDVRRRYWIEELKDVSVLDFPGSGSPANGASQRASQQEVVLAAGTLQGLQALARRERTTMHTVLLSAFLVLLHRWTGQEDIVVGVPVTGRWRSDLDAVAGYSVNVLPVRLQPRGEQSFIELLREVRDQVLAALRHELPFHEIVAATGASGDRMGTPLFQALCAVDSAPGGLREPLLFPSADRPLRIFNLDAEPMVVRAADAPFEIALIAEHSLSGVAAAIQVRRDTGDDDRAARLTEQWQRILLAVVENPDTVVGRLPLLSAAEHQFVLHEVNRTAAPVREICLHQWVAEQAMRTPDARAIADDAGSLSYRELVSGAAALAHRLRSMGINPESRVGLFLDRGTALVIGALGIVGAGGAFVYLDPDYPADHRAYICEDSGIAVVVTREALRDRMSAALQVITMEEVAAQRGSRNEFPATNVGPGSLAYVVYTSGSTGRPKGVAIEHRNIAALLAWAHGEYDLDQLAGVFAATSLAFDLSMFELFVPLTRGGTAFVARSPLDLERVGRQHHITLLNTVPSVMSELLALGAVPTSVRTVNLAGEPLPAALVRMLYALGHVERVYNLYGPTEDTTYSTFERVAPGAVPTLGRPLANRAAYLLDRLGQPVPVGVAGEIHLGGAGVARGYVNRPALSAERFVDGSAAGIPGRLYRTGDLGRRLADGRIQYLGRLDLQIKLRGFRIEPGEIVATLLDHGAVDAAAVVVDERQRLFAYVGAKGGADSDSLRHFAARRLPPFMVPYQIVVLEHLPLTRSGKIDMRVLQGLELRHTEPVVGAPSDEVESALIAQWHDVLGVTPRVDEDFFLLGGHSLLVVRAHARMQKHFGIALPLDSIFRNRTIAALAAEIRAAAPAPSGHREAGVHDTGERFPAHAPAVLSSAQQRLWLAHRLDPSGTAYNLAAILRMDAPVDGAVFARALRKVVERHEALRTTYIMCKSGVVLRISDEPAVDFRHIRLPDTEDLDVALQTAGAELARLPFDLAKDPGIRVVWIQRGNGDCGAVLATTHLAFDGSNQIFVDALENAYAAEAGERPAAIGPVASYRDYAAWQRTQAERAMQDDLPLWKERIAQCLEPLDLPCDRPRPPVRTGRGAVAPFQIDAELSGSVLALAEAESVTPHMALLTAWGVLLHRFSGRPRFTIGSPVDVRPPAAKNLIGSFVNPLVLALDFSGTPTFREALAQVRALVLEAQSRAALPFSALVEAMDRPHDASRTPLFQQMFAYTEALRSPRFGSARGRISPCHGSGARFDLLWAMQKSDDGELQGWVEYANDLFDGSTIERMIDSFRALLVAAVNAPGTSIDSLRILSEAERHRMLVDWNRTQTALHGELVLHRLFERAVDRAPDARAVAFRDTELTFAQLDARSNKLANLLITRGIGPGDRVGFWADRCLESVEVLMAILKTGAAYVPMPAGWPPARVSWVVQHLTMPALLTFEQLSNTLSPAQVPGLRNRLVIDGQETQHALAASSPTRPPSRANPDACAYVIFTSGSTGVPKGVIVRHRRVANVIDWVNRTFGVHGDDRMLLVTSCGFDLSVYDIFGVLAAGASLRIAETADLNDPARLAAWLDSDGITLWDSTPATLARIVPFIVPRKDQAPARPRLFFLSGDWVPVELTERIRRAFPGTEVVALGGATEAVIWSNYHRITTIAPDWRTIPYGKPIQNAAYYVLDAKLNPCPIGVTGELYIGGPVLADGYTDEQLTAQRFVPDPYAGIPGAVMYRTGDKARFWADGTIEFLGRLDQQMKIRGHRIERAEIEAVLRTHDGVAACVVGARPDATAEQRLIAWYVPAAQCHVSTTSLRAHAARHLPDYMRPSALVPISALPLTENGKPDLAKLPDPLRADTPPDLTFIAPRNDIEKLVARVWSQVLQVSEVGAEDNFFDMGGDSNTILQVQHSLENVLGRAVPVIELFRHATVAALAQNLSSGPQPESNAAEWDARRNLARENRRRRREHLTD